jgi:Protein of unknown function (DUF2842)
VTGLPQAACGTAAGAVTLVHATAEPVHAPIMNARVRKLVGTIVMIVLVLVYFALATEITTIWLPGKSTIVQVIGYAIAGLLWILPAGLLISWMSKPDAPR